MLIASIPEWVEMEKGKENQQNRGSRSQGKCQRNKNPTNEWSDEIDGLLLD